MIRHCRPANRMLLLAAWALLLAGCRKDPSPAQWDVDLLTPLATATLTIGDLVPDSLLSVDAMGNVSILYTAELFTLSLDTVLTAPDTSFQYAYALPVPGPVNFPPGTTFEANQDVTRFELDELQLTRLDIRTGTVEMRIANSIPGYIDGDFSLPGATSNGSPFNIGLALLPGMPGAPSIATTTRDLAGYSLDLRGPQYSDVNTLATSLSYASSPDHGSISITSQDSLLATVSYHGIVPQYATGYFGQRDIAVDPASTSLDLFNGVTGTLDLAEVTAVLRIRNGIGVDVRANIEYLRSVNSASGNTVDLVNAITAGPVNIDRAVDLGGSFQPAQNTFNLATGNSNIEAFFENLPDRIDYALGITIDPLGNISNGHDFLYYDSKLTAELEVDVPLRLIATNLTLQRSIPVDLPGTADGHAFQSGVLHLFADNGFPFSAAIALDIVDANGQVLSVLGPLGTVASATLGTDGFVSSTTASQLDVELSQAQVDQLYIGGNIRISATFNTADQVQHVQILNSYGMALQVTMEANYLVNGDN
ncbi:MAG: hypothetical protein ACOH13_12290 [Flavobacteriales bacterium]